MFMEERQSAILKRLTEQGRISVAEIQQQFGISLDSARRDLRVLEEKGLLKRTHGGAIEAAQVDVRPPRVRDLRNMEIFDNYAAIARMAATFVKENDVIYLTSGSLGFIMLKYLPRDIRYTLVVNSATLADELKYWDNLTVYVIGGRMGMQGSASMVDSMATAFVSNLHFDMNFMTGAGVEAAFGFSTGSDETATFQRAVIDHSRRNILMMPNQKVGFRSFVRVCAVNRFDTLITDWDALDEALLKIQDAGVDVRIARKPE